MGATARIGRIVILAGLGLGACSGGSDSGDTDETDTGTDPGDTSDSGVDSATDGVDTSDTEDSDTDTGPVGPMFADEDWTDGWMDAVTVEPNANAGRGRVTIRLETANGGQVVALYLGGMTLSPRTNESHTMPGALSEDPDRKAWQRVLDCDDTPDATSTEFRCDGSRDHFTRESDFQAVGMAAAVWKIKGTETTAPPDDCIVFGKNAEVLRTDSLPTGIAPPAWVGADCREVEEGGM